jgi:hypothetical protein
LTTDERKIEPRPESALPAVELGGSRAPTPSSGSAGGIPPPASHRPSLSISWDDLHRPEIDDKIKKQEAIARSAESRPALPPSHAEQKSARSKWWLNTVVYMSFFGLLGGVMGWGLGTLLNFRPDAETRAKEAIDTRQVFVDARNAGRMTPEVAERAMATVSQYVGDNPYYKVWSDDSLSEADKSAKISEIEKRDAVKDFLANMMFYGASGMTIALCLGAAEALVTRNWPLAGLDGTIGAVLGLIGGVTVALFIGKVEGFVTAAKWVPQDLRGVAAKTVAWALLGLFLSLAPGIVMRNMRRFTVGLIGGVIGGAVGGVLCAYIHPGWAGELVGILAIGLFTGLSTGLIENAAKAGWLKVTGGLIAGKQFVLYRNPTYIGSSLQCNVYLFKDPQVGKRHAAVHIVPGGYEIEDLPLGGPTLINGKPIARARLRAGDAVQIGATSFLFQERAKST